MRMDTRRSKSALESKKTSPNKDSGKGNVEKLGDSSSEQESINDSVDSKIAEPSGSTLPNREKSGMVTRSVGKSLSKEENVGKRSPAKTRTVSLSDSTRDSPESSSESPPPKRKKISEHRKNNYIELSGNDEESSQDDDSSLRDPLQLESSSASNSEDCKIISGDKSKVTVISVEQEEDKINANRPKMGKAPFIKVKRVVKGTTEGEIKVLTSYEEAPSSKGSSKQDVAVGGQKPVASPDKIYRTYSGPVRKPLPAEGVPQSAKKYMILDKATIKEMMEKGLVQTIKKDGANQTIATYRAVVPKGETSFLSKLASASVSSLPPVLNMSPISQTVGPTKQIGNPALSTLSTTFKPVTGTSTLISGSPTVPSKSVMTVLTSSTAPGLVSSATTMSSSGTAVVPSSGVKIQIPATTLANGKAVASSIPQVFTSPLFVKTSPTSTAGKQGNFQVVAIPSDILQQLQHIQKSVGSAFTVSASSATSGKPIFTNASGPQQGVKVITKGGTVATTVSITDDPDDPDFSPSAEASDESGEEVIEKQKAGGKYGVPTGVCKVLKSMKMYQFVDKKKQKGVPAVIVNKTGNTNVRWIAVPNKPGDSKLAGVAQLQQSMPTTIPVSFSNVGNDSAGSSQATKSRGSNLRRILKEMKLHHARLIGKHRTRYSRLQKKYLELERDYKEVEDVGSPQQIVRDAKSYMSDEHSLFFESQMFMNNTEGKGNRFSKSFMQLMIDLYNKSPAGYRYLKTVFTVPSIKTIKKLQERGCFARGTPEVGSSYGKHNEDSSSNTVTDTSPTKVKSNPPNKNLSVRSEEQGEKDFVGFPSERGKSVMVDSKEWFQSGIVLGESLPATSGQTVFLSSKAKKSMLNIKIEAEDIETEDLEEGEIMEGNEDEDVDVEEFDGSASSDNSKSGQSELGETGEITTFENIAKKVLVVPDNESPSKQDMTIQWDETWGSIE